MLNKIELFCGLFVDELGNVYGPDGTERTKYLDGGYYKVSWKRKFYKVHRLMAEAFLGDTSLTVNHKNGIKTDNRLINLEMMSLLDNLNHAFQNNLHCNPKRRVNRIDVNTGETVMFDSVMDAVRETPKAHNANIYRAIRNPDRMCAGYYWRFAT